MKWIAVVLLVTVANTVAERPWPKKIAEPIFVQTDSATLPHALQKALLGFDDFGRGTEALPQFLDVCRTVLGPKGASDYIVMVPDGFSGGPEIYIFELRGEKYVQIAFEQGLQYFGSRVNGYRQLVCQGRGGAGAYLRTLLEFKSGRYRLVRMVDYQMDIDGGALKFVRERDPKEFPTW